MTPPDANEPRRDMAAASGGPAVGRITEPVSGDLLLDLAIFEDGLCVRQDRHGGFDALMAELPLRRIATKILQVLQKGASRGDIFEIVRPLAKGPPRPPPQPGPGRSRTLRTCTESINLRRH